MKRIDLDRMSRQAELALEFMRRTGRRKKLTSFIAKLAEIRADRGASPAEEAFARTRLLDLRAELAALPKVGKFLPSHLPRQPRKHRGGRPRKVEVTLPEVRKSRRARILGDL